MAAAILGRLVFESSILWQGVNYVGVFWTSLLTDLTTTAIIIALLLTRKVKKNLHDESQREAKNSTNFLSNLSISHPFFILHTLFEFSRTITKRYSRLIILQVCATKTLVKAIDWKCQQDYFCIYYIILDSLKV